MTFQSSLPADTATVLFGVFKSSEGQTAGIATGGVTMSAGEVSKAYAVAYNVATGTYTAYLFVISVTCD